MTAKNRPAGASVPNKPQAATRQERREREAEALRANLKKRKQQARARATTDESKR